jgi:hypothetical protein
MRGRATDRLGPSVRVSSPQLGRAGGGGGEEVGRLLGKTAHPAFFCFFLFSFLFGFPFIILTFKFEFKSYCEFFT